MNDGLTGWLSPSGVFYGCGYGEHYDLARRMFNGDVGEDLEDELRDCRIRVANRYGRVLGDREVLELSSWVPMGVPHSGSDPGRDYLFIKYGVGVTDEQLDWFEENRDVLSETQYGFVEEYLEDIG